jgi:hypothetical protein
MSQLKWLLAGMFCASGAIAACSGGGGGTMSGTDSGSPDGKTTKDSGVPKDSGTAKDTGTKADTGPITDTGTPTDTGPSDAGACGADSVDAAGKTYAGVLLLSRVTLPKPVRYGSLGQYEPLAMRPPSGCTGMMMGDCCYQSSSGTTLPTLESAGTITVDDGTTTIGTLLPTDYVESSKTTPTFTWMGGDTLNVSATGATVDAFNLSVRAPRLLAAITPALTSPLSVSISKDFVVSWKPSTEMCAQVEFGFSQGATLPYIGCVADDSAGTITVPKALLSKFTAATGTAVMERIETSATLVTNAYVGVVASEVLQDDVTFKP